MTERSHEHTFYLEQFRGQLLVIANPTIEGDTAFAGVAGVVTELVEHGAKVVHVHADRVGATDLDDRRVVDMWAQLDASGLATVTVESADGLIGQMQVGTPLIVATEVAARLRANKLVLLAHDHARSGLGGRVDESYIALDADQEHDGAVELAARALRSGVSSVNVVDIDGLVDELFTYRGAGTLYTSGDYVRIDRVGFGDYSQVRRLIMAGVADGFLKPRDEAEIRQLVVNGYGARVEGDHIAGFAALLTEPYRQHRVGEITALSTISRFTGGGVGSRLVNHLLTVADGRHLDSVFATTTSPAAVSFFERAGFKVVGHDEIPAAKWLDYDIERQQSVTSLLRNLDE